MIAGGFEVLNKLGRSDIKVAECFRPDGPDGGDPGKIGACVPFFGEVEPLAWAYGFFDGLAGFEGEEGRVTDQDGCVCLLQHGDGIGCGGKECRVGVEKFAKENLGVGERTARSGVSRDGFHRAVGVRRFDDELDGADFVQRSDGAARNDREVGREGGDRD